MKKISKRLSALFLSVVTVLSVFVFPVTGSAAEVGEQDQRSVVELQAVNSTVTPQEDGFQVRVELVEQTDERLWVPAGIATFDIKINSSNTGGHCDWNVALSNGDLIKGVYGTMEVKQDLFGPFNPVWAKMKVRQTYTTGTLFGEAHGSEDFAFGDYEKLDEDENIIFKWYDFSVSGVKHVYDVTDGEKQGEIGDF